MSDLNNNNHLEHTKKNYLRMVIFFAKKIWITARIKFVHTDLTFVAAFPRSHKCFVLNTEKITALSM